MLRPRAVLLCLLWWSTPAFCQENETMSMENSSGTDSVTTDVQQAPHVSFLRQTGFHGSDYLHFLTSNLGYQATSPFKTRLSFKTLLPLSIAAASLIGEDRRLNHQMRGAKTKYWLVDKGSPVITRVGGYHSLILLGGLGALGIATHNEKLTTTVMLSSQAFITSGVWAFVFKTAFGRTRPYEYNHWTGPGRVFRPQDRSLKDCSEFNSFPSGHTTTAFAIATVFAKRYKSDAWVGVTAYSLATLVGISRMTENRHWGSDVLAGGILGYLCGSAVVKNYERTLCRSAARSTKLQNRLSRIDIMPVYNVNATSLLINYTL
ncbi:MAG: phosphatase PAP2 family protein [Chitinophagaceae bacterium]